MADLTLSPNMDDLLSSADYASAKSKLGILASTNPNITYVRTDGNDTTGDGSPEKPFLTVQHAITAGKRVLDVGVGAFSSATFGTGVDETVWVRGSGIEQTGVAFYNPGHAITFYDMAGCSVYVILSTTPANAMPGGVTSTAGSITTFGGCVSCHADGATNNNEPFGYAGGHAGNIYVNGPCRFTTLSANGGNGGDPNSDTTPSGDGGNAGSISITGSAVNASIAFPSSDTPVINYTGGITGTNSGGGPVGTNGADGALTLVGVPVVPTPTPNSNITCAGAVIGGVFHIDSYP